MLRVCGITFTHSPNYGSCLQTYALQHAIEKMIVNGKNCSYQVIPVRMFKDYPVDGLYGRIVNMLMAWNRLQYQSFYKKYMHYADCSCMNDLPKLNDRYDAFVCGSDVIWNDSFNSRVGAYFLDFANKYKFSYAASFGKSDLSYDYAEYARKKIDKLNAISVREPSAKIIAERFTKKPVTVVADPVFLVDCEQWEKIASKVIVRKPYIFVYVTHLNETIKQFLSALQTTTGLCVIWAVAGPKQAIKKGFVRVQTPEKWLGQLHNAEYVVTNSFHATAFSVLFHKRFFTVVNGEKEKGINVRMNDFLTTVGLEDRLYNTVPEKFNLSDIDFTHTDEKIEQMREQSLEFLQRNLEAAYAEKCKVESGEV